MGYIVCKKCGGYYELQKGESAEDFESCQCGGQLVFSDTEDLSESNSSLSELSESKLEGENGGIKTCPNCGSEISEYSIICRVCGEKIDMDMDMDMDMELEDEPLERKSVDLEQNQPLNEGVPTDEIPDKSIPPQEIDEKIVDKTSERKKIFCHYCGKENDPEVNECKYCQKEINIEQLKLKKSKIPPKIPQEEPEMLHCPYCGAQVSEHSIVCRSCGKHLDSPEKMSGSENRIITCSRCGRKESDLATEYCKSCGNPLGKASKIQPDSYSDDYLAMFSSRSFLIYIAVSLIIPAVIGFVVSPPNIALIFIIIGMGFSFSYRGNIANCMLGGLLLGITGYLSELMFHSLWAPAWNLSSELTLFFIFAAFGLIGGLIGNQLVERGIVA